ncbi:hypothetical protein [Citreimonas sp.]|uniref:hypothetical protein n=1 Tax=Citreimonas sp. TaxID=3036715 RepID=UPI0040588978
MNDDRGGFDCTTGSWALAVGAGGLTFVLLMVLGDWRFFGAVFIAAVVTAGLGVLCQLVFCGGTGSKGWLKATPPADPADTSITYAHARRQAEARGETPPAGPVEATSPAGASVLTPSSSLKTDKTPSTAPADEAKPSAAPAEAGKPREPAKPVPPADPVPASTPAPGAALDENLGTKPETLDAPRGGSGDDLKKIKGVGPKLAENLNAAGVYHYDQIAGWSADEVAWVEDNVDGAKGRIIRDDWVAQAKTLSAG